MSELIEGGIVTLSGLDPKASNTYILDTLEEDTVILSHPLHERFLMRVLKNEVDRAAPTVKDSLERGLDYINNHRGYLSSDQFEDFEALCLSFIHTRKMSMGQKKLLSDIRGNIAKCELKDDIRKAVNVVNDNSGVLDSFNLMWYNNFHEFFTNGKRVRSPKQRDSIFNIAGFVLSEMQNPSTNI